jgi:hypothetical protein
MIYLRLTLTRTVIDDGPHPRSPHRYEGEALHAARLGCTPTLAIEHLPVAALPPRRRWLAGLLRGIATKLER